MTKKKAGKKVLSKAELIARCKALPTKEVEIQGWGESVQMQNVTFSRLIEMRKESGTDNELYAAMIVGAVCGLSDSELVEMQQGNGSSFMALFNAANEYLSSRFEDEAVKK